jgi:hypothetical protein
MPVGNVGQQVAQLVRAVEFGHDKIKTALARSKGRESELNATVAEGPSVCAFAVSLLSFPSSQFCCVV